MKNLRDMSDAEFAAYGAELNNEAQSQIATAPPEDLSKMSDEAFTAYGQSLAAMYSRAKGAESVTPQPEKVPTYPGEIGPPTPDMLTAGIQQFHNIADPLAQQALEFGNTIGEEKRFIDQNQQFVGQDSNAPMINGAIAGGLKSTDAIINLLMRAPTMGLSPLPTVDLEHAYESLPWSKESQTLAPNLYGMAKAGGEMVAPLPALGNMLKGAATVIPKLGPLAEGVGEGQILPNMLNEALQGATINSGLTAGQQIKDQNIDLLKVLESGAMGLAGGAALSGGIRGGIKLLGGARKGVNGLLKNLYKPSAQDALESAAAARMRAGEAPINTTAGAPAPEQLTDWEIALRDIENASDVESKRDAIREANKIRKEMTSGLAGTREGKDLNRQLGAGIDTAATAQEKAANRRAFEARQAARAAAAPPPPPPQSQAEAPILKGQVDINEVLHPSNTGIDDVDRFPEAFQPLMMKSKHGTIINPNDGRNKSAAAHDAIFAQDLTTDDIDGMLDAITVDQSRKSYNKRLSASVEDIRRQGILLAEKQRRAQKANQDELIAGLSEGLEPPKDYVQPTQLQKDSATLDAAQAAKRAQLATPEVPPRWTRADSQKQWDDYQKKNNSVQPPEAPADSAVMGPTGTGRYIGVDTGLQYKQPPAPAHKPAEAPPAPAHKPAEAPPAPAHEAQPLKGGLQTYNDDALEAMARAGDRAASDELARRYDINPDSMWKDVQAAPKHTTTSEAPPKPEAETVPETAAEQGAEEAPRLKGGVQTQGEFRLIAQHYGRDKVFAEDTKWHPNDRPLTLDEAVNRDYITEEGKQLIQEAAEAKLAQDEAEYIYENAAEQFHRKFKNHPDVTQESVRPGKEKARSQEVTTEKLSSESENVLAQERFDLADETLRPGQRAHIAGLAEHQYGSGKKDLLAGVIELSDDLETAIAQVAEAKRVFSGKPTKADPSFISAEQARKDAYDKAISHIQAAEDAHTLATGDDLAKLHLNVETPTLDRTGKPVRVQMQHEQQSFELHVQEEAQAQIDLLKEALTLSDSQKGTIRKSTTFKFHAYKAVAGGAAAIGSLIHGTQAKAADLAAQVVQHAGAHWLDVAHAPGVEAGAITALMAAVGPVAARKVLNSKSMILRMLYTNTNDNIKYIDRLLADAEKASGKKASKPLHYQIHVEAMGEAYKASFGVHFPDQVARQSALNRLRNGDISPTVVKNMKGLAVPIPATTKEPTAKEIFQSLNADQRWAVLKQHEGMGKIQKAVEKKIDALQSYVVKLAKAEGISPEAMLRELNKDGRFKLGRAALNTVMEGVTPGRGSSISKEGDRILSHWVGAYYDGLFALNTAHHLTNTTDHLIAGLAATGPVNMAKADAALMFNGTIKKHFKSSNLIGSYASDINDLKATGQHENKGLEGFQSDKFNADRVALASWYQFYNQKVNKDQFARLGISESQFIQDMLTGDPKKMAQEQLDLLTNAWGHMAETISDTLGADIYHLNKTAISQGVKSAAIGVFLAQPARMARQMMNYMAEGNFKAMGALIGMTAVIGGSAAIPPSLKTAWGMIDPEGLNQTANALDEHSISGALGRPMAKKLDWDYLWPAFASALPLGEDLKKAYHEQPQKVFEKTVEYLAEAATNPKKANELLPALARVYATAGTTITVAAASPRAAGIPLRYGIKGARSAAYAAEGETPVYMDSFVGGASSPKTVKFKDVRVEAGEQHTDQFLPGMDMWKYQNSKWQAEVKAIKQQAAVIQSAEKLTRGSGLNPFFKDLVSRQKLTKPSYSRFYKGPNRSPYSLIRSLSGDKGKK